MKITQITVFQKDLPLEHPYWLSGGRLKFEVLDATFVKLETDEGLTGWGEGTPWGHTYVPAHGPGIRRALKRWLGLFWALTPAIISTSNVRWTSHFLATYMPNPRSTWRAGISQVRRRAGALLI